MIAPAGNVSESLSWILSATVLGSLTKGAVLFLAGYLVTSVVRRLRPAHRARIWLLVIAGTVIFAGAWMVRPSQLPGFPTIRASILTRPSVVQRVTAEQPAAGDVTARNGAPKVSSSIPMRDSEPPLLSRLAPFVILAFWALGALYLLTRLLVGGLSARRLLRHGSHSASLESFGAELSGTAAGAAEVKVVTTCSCSIPFTFGIHRPLVFVPAAFPRWAGWKKRAVLLHELEHIRRRDGLFNLLTLIACSVLWFVPTAWIARRFLLREEELACDERVLQDGICGSDYAAGIVELLRSAGGRLTTPVAYTSFGSTSTIKKRVRSILAWTRGHEAARGHAGKAVALAFILLLPLIALSGADLEPMERNGASNDAQGRSNAGGGAGTAAQLAQAKSFWELARTGTPQEVQEAIGRGADVNAASPSLKMTALWLAGAYNENPEVIATLLKAGADVNLTTDGRTALMGAAWSTRNPEVVNVLLRAGAAVNARHAENFGRTALMYAAEHSQNPEVVLALLQGGADARQKDFDGKTALDMIQHNYVLRRSDALKQLQDAAAEKTGGKR
jgi:beta-lactamase regulating signal transducer with metallopeptidase domain